MCSMKFKLFLLFFLIFFGKTFSQNKTISFYSSLINLNNSPEISYNGPTYGGRIFSSPISNTSYGINISTRIKKNFELETGFQFTTDNFKSFYSGPLPSNTLIEAPTYGNINLLTIPVKARISFLKYFFVGGSVLFDIQTQNNVTDASNNQLINNQSGVGFAVTAGAKYDIKKRVTFFANLTKEAHSLFLFQKVNYPYKIENVFFNLGAGYRL